MGIFDGKTTKKLVQAQQILQEAAAEMAKDIEQLTSKQQTLDKRVDDLEKKQDAAAKTISDLQDTIDKMRDSAIRGEVASGRKTKDVAHKFCLSPARVSQIAPRRRYNNG